MSPANSLQNVEGMPLVTLLVGTVLAWSIRRLHRFRPELRIAWSFAVAFGIRLLAIAGISATELQATLRGGNETTFLGLARILASQPLGTGDFPHRSRSASHRSAPRAIEVTPASHLSRRRMPLWSVARKSSPAVAAEDIRSGSRCGTRRAVASTRQLVARRGSQYRSRLLGVWRWAGQALAVDSRAERSAHIAGSPFMSA
jgi:hypothetical protein